MSSFFLLTLFQIGYLALTHMENPTALEVNDNGLVHVPFSDDKLIYADAVYSLKMMSVNLFDRVPRYTQKLGCVFEGIPFNRSTTYLAKRRV